MPECQKQRIISLLTFVFLQYVVEALLAGALHRLPAGFLALLPVLLELARHSLPLVADLPGSPCSLDPGPAGQITRASHVPVGVEAPG